MLRDVVFKCGDNLISGFEDKSLPNPHYRSSLSGLQQCSKLLRVYYCKCAVCCSTSGDSVLVSPVLRQIAHRSFITQHKPFPLSRLNLACQDADIHAEIDPSIMQEINEWIEKSSKLT
jgi:hypothetical protein